MPIAVKCPTVNAEYTSPAELRRRATAGRAIVVAAALVAAVPATAGAATSLVNPSLETASGSTPSCWTLGGYGTNSYTWTRTTDAHSGTYAEKLSVSSFSSGDRKLVSKQDTGTCAPAAAPGHSYAVKQW